jgi:hypothetical protein
MTARTRDVDERGAERCEVQDVRMRIASAGALPLSAMTSPSVYTTSAEPLPEPSRIASPSIGAGDLDGTRVFSRRSRGAMPIHARSSAERDRCPSRTSPRMRAQRR